MTTCVIEVNDAELRAAQNGEVVATSAGCAALVDGELVLGAAAELAARRAPRSSENRHFRDLSLAPVEHLGRRVRHHADLAWLQLETLRQQAGNPANVILAVPGSFSDAQLSLLLGVAQGAGLVPTGLVDSAVAAAAATLASGRWIHLDLQAHQAVLTALSVDTEVARELVEVLPGLGTLRLREACLEVAAAAFLRDARFDPLHQADAEAALLEALPRWLAELRRDGELIAFLDHAGRRFEARLHHAKFITALAPLLGTLQSALPAGRLPVASHRLGRQPGFEVVFDTTPVLDARAVFQGARLLPSPEPTDGRGLPRVLVLPASANPTCRAPMRNDAAVPSATHLLAGTTAHAATADARWLTADGDVRAVPDATTLAAFQRDAQGLSVRGREPGQVLVNGRAINAAQLLLPGDRVSFVRGPGVFTAIEVAAADGA